MKALRLWIILLCGFGNIVLANIYTESFLRLSPDAVSRSLGGPNPAYSIGAVDLFINPALLSQHSLKELQFSNTIDLLSNRYMSIAYSTPVKGRDNIGIGLLGLDTSPVQESIPGNVRIRKTQHYQFGLIVAYARSLFPFSLGASIKYFRIGAERDERLETASALGVELGFRYAATETLSFGLIYQSPFYLGWEEGVREKAPGKIGMGLAWTPDFISENFFQILLSTDRYQDEPFQVNAGVAITPVTKRLGLKNFSLRAGMGNFDLDTRSDNSIANYLTDSAPTFTIGAGLGIDTGLNRGISLDYCFQIEEYITNRHIITTRLRF